MATSAPIDFMATMRRPIEDGVLLPGMARRPGHVVGTRWLYQSTHMRSLGPDAGFEEYDVVQGCVIERVSYTRNFPETPIHLVTLDNGNLVNANLIALTAYLGPAFTEGDIRVAGASERVSHFGGAPCSDPVRGNPSRAHLATDLAQAKSPDVDARACA